MNANITPIDLKQVNQSIQKSLVKSSVLSDNNCTTKQLTAKPSRHPMAIFMPSILQSTGVNTTVFHNFAPCKIMRIVGLITQNTIALWVNMRSRLVAVVETQHHLFLNGILTKQLGA